MDFFSLVRSRHMVRSFRTQPLDPALVGQLVEAALRAPTAGNTRGTAWLVLSAPPDRARYWDLATTPDWRATSRRWPGLARAPVLALSLTSPHLYRARYREPDKAASGLGGSAPQSTAGAQGAWGAVGKEGVVGDESTVGDEPWPVPYWFGDAAFSTMVLLLGATQAGIASCFLGAFRAGQPILDAFGVPQGWRLFGTVLLGHPDGQDRPSGSLDRPPPSGPRAHLGAWGVPLVSPGTSTAPDPPTPA